MLHVKTFKQYCVRNYFAWVQKGNGFNSANIQQLKTTQIYQIKEYINNNFVKLFLQKNMILLQTLAALNKTTYDFVADIECFCRTILFDLMI
jgi:hypothetical protein